ncbi:MAG: hypothetical protein H0T68_03165 [Gemmatimonadales bacterium]|nr:hypothetical protein [Gemmatimonadales bacterium]
MTRWTILAISFAIAACSEGERDRASRDASDAAAGADTALRADSVVTETGTAGRADTEATSPPNARAAAPPSTGTPAARGPTGAEAMGGVRSDAAQPELSTDQVRRLQTALNDAGCDAGTADGVMGRRTRQAIACGLEKNSLGSDDLNGLYRALDLDF